MRNWNTPWYTSKVIASASVFSLPMRNWNYRPSFIMLSPGAFSVYLWGIETARTGRAPPVPRCFQSTYEELKQNCKCFNRCYRLPVFSLPMRNWNIWSSNFSLIKSSVFSLPMRNWNYSPYAVTDKSFVGFQSTYEELKHGLVVQNNGRHIVFSLPMRNWNLVASFIFLFCCIVFSLPMRNWNALPTLP